MTLKGVLITICIILGLIAGTYFGLNTLRSQSIIETREVLNDARGNSAQREILIATEIYFAKNKEVPADMSEMSSYVRADYPGLDLIEYRRIDAHNAEVCLVGQTKCERFTGRHEEN